MAGCKPIDKFVEEKISKEYAEQIALQYYADLEVLNNWDMDYIVKDSYTENGYWKVIVVVNRTGYVTDTTIVTALENQINYVAINSSTGEIEYLATPEGEEMKQRERLK